MASRFALLVLLAALALASAAAAAATPSWESAFGFNNYAGLKVGDIIDQNEEMGMESESTRRSMAGRAKHISYAAMRKGSVPCNRRGASYYNCNKHGQANPYSRGCTRITKCARNTR